MNKPSWLEIHIHHHGEEMQRVVAQAVPAALEVLRRNNCHDAAFARGWITGPHIRIVARAPAELDEPKLCRDLNDAVAPLLGELPIATWDEAAAVVAHARMAEEEGIQSPLPGWCPDNDWHFAEHDEKPLGLENIAMHDLAWRFLACTNQNALAIARLSRDDRLVRGFQSIAYVLDRFWKSGIAGSRFSARSHAEAFLARDQAGQLRSQWDEYYSRHALELQQRLVRAVRGSDPDESALSAAATEAQGLYADGILPLASTPTAAQTRLLSAFHRAVSAADWNRKVGQTEEFAVFRVVLNLKYLQLFRAGVSGFERYLLCHLLASAADDVLSASSMSFVRRIAGDS